MKIGEWTLKLILINTRAILFWFAIGVLISWLQTALSSLVFVTPRGSLVGPIYEGYSIEAVRPPRGWTNHLDTTPPKPWEVQDIGAIGRWIADSFFRGPGNTICGQESPTTDYQQQHIITYEIAVDRRGWPIPCWDSWAQVTASGKVILGIPTFRARHDPTDPRIYATYGMKPPTHTATLPVVPILEHLWISALFWSLVSFGVVRGGRAAMRHWRRQPWQCRGCGYDMRGHIDSATCPECGRESATCRSAQVS